jgi:hypothetical protein
MLFHVTYKASSQHRDAIQNRFKETGALPPEGVKMLGRWHSADGAKGFVLAETSDAVAIGAWCQDWTDILAFEITPVLDDDQMMQVIG